jgi:hypothetical protein
MMSEATAGSFVGALSSPFLAMLSIADTAFHADLHIYSAYLFFVLNVIAVVVFCDLFRRIKNAMQEQAASKNEVVDPFWEKTYKIKKYVCVCFFIAFLVYIPIGLAVNCTMLRLSMDDCKTRYNLGEDYCNERFYKVTNGTSLTVLFDYSLSSTSVPSTHSSTCKATNTM